VMERASVGIDLAKDRVAESGGNLEDEKKKEMGGKQYTSDT
jgi:hypothetical protein